ncbi:DgsA anti-repressor MtfA [Duffyella gerundensis]|uniref:DgsA anti-repressor MtfA n=1 Tax=Duffyella gerundensis TaxID=1619313 RepID=UPI001CE2D427|nr:DgsA anti-repressor MtfA [Duffyella gerundensis]UCB30647.1 DgsA anti-repressor MtfA [Duffyella gerundensis]
MIKWPWKSQAEEALAALPWQQALSAPLFSVLSDQEQQQLIALASQFLRQKRLVALQDLQLDAESHARIALLFCLPVMQLGLAWLDGFHEVLIYPAPFIVNDSWQDEDCLVHAERTTQSGQSWLQGPVVLNWQDILDSFDFSGFNLVIHEVAHKLEARGSGYNNGVPPVALRDVARWEREIQLAMADIEQEIMLVGEYATRIDAYAASDAAECFAVLSEYFFTAPELLMERFPTLYGLYRGFYQQDPLLRLTNQATTGD